MASCRAASVAAFAMWMPKKSEAESRRGVSCRYPANAIVLFLIAEAALHSGRTQSPDYSSGSAYVGVFILWLRAFADKTCRYAVFGTVPPVVVVGIDGVSSDFGDFDSGQFLLIFNTLL